MLKTPEAAEYLGVSVDTLKRWRRRTQREDRQIGPKWARQVHGLMEVVVYDEAELDQFKNRTVIA